MASRFAASDIHELLDCPVCLDRFSQTHIPKLLPCSHNVCSPCLQRLLVGQTLMCPFCRKSTSVHNGDVNTLITNLPIIQLADIQPLGKCQACLKESKTTKCFHCEENICLECLHKHTQKTKSKMLDLHERLNQSLKDAENFQQKMDGAMTSFDISTVAQIETINTQFEMLMKQLRTRRAYLLQEVNTYVESMKHQYQQINQVLHKKVDPLRPVLIKVRDQIADVRGKLTQDTIHDTYTTGMRIITELRQTLPTCTIDFPKVQLQEQIHAVVGEIDRWGKVTSEQVVRIQYRSQKTALVKENTMHQPQKSALNPVQPRPAQNVARVDYSQRGRLVKRLQSWRSGLHVKQFGDPLGVAVDAVSGEVFVADGYHHHVHVFTSSRQHLRSFGGHGSSLGQFSIPRGICINHSREVIVCEKITSKCQMLTHTGKSIRQFGHEESRKGGLSCPADVSVDNMDTMYVTSIWDHCVKVYNKDGTYSRSIGSRGSGPGQFDYPHYIHWFYGRLLVCDNNGVQLWSDSGEFIRSIGTSTDPEPLITPNGVTVDQYRSILVLDAADHTVKVFSAEGQFVTKFPVAECQAGKDDQCYLTCTPEGSVIISDSVSKSVLFY